MKRPSFQFYPADWKNNAKLRRCSEAARGAWVDVMCLLHDMDEYGVCRWPLAELARAAGVQIKLAKELAAKDVLKGADKGAADYTYAPRHAGKVGQAVTLVVGGDGPCWYCSRFVRDEYVRQKRGSGTRFTADNQPGSVSESDDIGTQPEDGQNDQPNSTPKHTIGVRQGDGPTSTSTSTNKTSTTSSSDDDLRKCPVGTLVNLYHELMPMNPQVKVINDTRKRLIRARWAEAAKLDCEPFGYTTRAAGLNAWRQFFAICSESKFLTGRAPSAAGKPPFIADIDFLFSASGFAKTLENKYHRDAE